LHSVNIVLTDFGLIAKENEIDPSICGTIEYMAPERLIKNKRN
jgi:serine/threonine protein kinase